MYTKVCGDLTAPPITTGHPTIRHSASAENSLTGLRFESTTMIATLSRTLRVRRLSRCPLQAGGIKFMIVARDATLDDGELRMKPLAITRIDGVVASLGLFVAGLAPCAVASPFVAFSYDAGGGLPGVAGQGFTTNGPGFYNRAGDGNTTVLPIDPSLWLESAANHSAYDSYFTLSNAVSRLSSVDTVGDSLSPQLNAIYGDTTRAASQATIAAGSHIGATGDTDGQAPYSPETPVNQARAGVVANPQGVGAFGVASTLNSLSGRQGVFIAQLTVRRGASLSGSIEVVTLLSPQVTSTGTLILNGAGAQLLTSSGERETFFLRSYLVGQNDDLSHSRSGGNDSPIGTQRFGAADVYHLWVEAVPAPAALVTFGLAGLIGLRRRALR